jgi:thiol-disulfide isomerase/thioredoxin
MQFSSKDKSLILFICSFLIVLWLVFVGFSKVFDALSFKFSSIHQITKSHEKWFNINEKISAENLENRLILLHFWNRSCVPCLEALPAIKELEKKHGNKLTVIGIYSAKFAAERNQDLIRSAIIKYDINHLVISDSKELLAKEFEIKGQPSFVLIKPNGGVYKKYQGLDSLTKLTKDAAKLVNKYRYDLQRQELPILPEKSSLIGNVLSFPAKLEYSSNLLYNSKLISALFIANAGQNDIVVSSLAGGILFKIGDKFGGFADGNFFEAKFQNPQSALFDNQKLYIADTGNHALRVVDFKNGKVATLVGNGSRGGILKEESDAKKINLSSPTDLEFFPDKNHIIIANAGSNQILSYNLTNNKISPLANNAGQVADMVVLKDKIYFLDSLSSQLKSLDKNGNIAVLVKNNLQNPSALTHDGSAIYIADSFNNRIAKYAISSQKLTNFIGNEIGDEVGNKTSFNSPEGILKIKNNFYISDSNNNRIVLVNAKNLNSEILDVIPPLKLPREGFLQYLPNLVKSPDILLKNNEILTLKINLNEGWKINEEAPSFVNLLEIIGNKKANLLASFDWHFVRAKEIKLPKLEEGENYLLQGSIYYCEDKKNALCYVKSYEQKLIIDDAKDAKLDFEIKLGY